MIFILCIFELPHSLRVRMGNYAAVQQKIQIKETACRVLKRKKAQRFWLLSGEKISD